LDIEVRSLLRGAAETISFGRRIGALAIPGDWVALTGDLGAGKTTLVSGIVEGIHPGARSRSPTYVRVEVYGASPAIVHADLYRLQAPGEWDTLGIEDLADRDAIVLVEWADRAPDRLPSERLELTLRYSGEAAREIRIHAQGERWHTLIKEGKLDREYWSDALYPRD
jgi:tRNA threonylcarbamoyl adenosine modification protein YjeE